MCNFSRVLRTCAGEVERVYLLVMLGSISVGYAKALYLLVLFFLMKDLHLDIVLG